MKSLQLFCDRISDGRIAVRAEADGVRVGVGIAVLGAPSGTAKLRALVVAPSHRGRGIGHRLVSALERQAREHGSSWIEALYDAAEPSAAILHRVFDKQQWARPPLTAQVFHSTTRIAEASWMRARAAPGYDLFAWTESTSQELAQLARQNWPHGLGPLPPDEVDAATSVGVRCGGRVVGWMLTQRVAHDLLRYSRLFVAQEHRRRVSGVVLLAESIRRQSKAGIPRGTFSVASANSAMMLVVKRRIAMFIDTRLEVCYASKDLTGLRAHRDSVDPHGVQP
jgi:GNAT superfamily N-acetyltransferase